MVKDLSLEGARGRHPEADVRRLSPRSSSVGLHGSQCQTFLARLPIWDDLPRELTKEPATTVVTGLPTQARKADSAAAKNDPAGTRDESGGRARKSREFISSLAHSGAEGQVAGNLLYRWRLKVDRVISRW